MHCEDDAYTHDLDRLSRLSGLRPQLDLDMQIDTQLRTNWSTTVGWTEQSRYEQRSRTDAEELFQAVMDRRRGVLQWLRRYWQSGTSLRETASCSAWTARSAGDHVRVAKQ